MLQFHLVFPGKTQFPDLDAAIKRYLDRLAHYTSIQVHVIKAEKISHKTPDEEIRRREAERVLKLIDRQPYVVIWDERGRQMNSLEMAAFLDSLMKGGHSDIWMVFGGPVGVSSHLRAQANTVLSLSKMTFPHDMARLLVVEQLYRAFTILRGEPYHK